MFWNFIAWLYNRLLRGACADLEGIRPPEEE